MNVFFATTIYPVRRLWAGLVAFLIAVGSGHFYAIDEDLMYGTTLRMWISIQHLFNPAITLNTAILTQYGPMQSFLALFTMPFGSFLASIGPGEMQTWLLRLPSTWINAVMVATIAVILGWLSIQRRQSVAVAVAVALTYAIATPALKYASCFFSEPTASFFLLVALLPVLLPKEYTITWQRRYIVCGLACIGAVLTKIAVIPAVFFIGVAVALVAFHDRDWRKLITWGSGAVISGVLFLIYNILARGDILSSGYHSHESGYAIDWEMVKTGFYGQFFSSGKSIFLYAPLLILWPLGLWLQRRQWRWLFAPLSVVVAITFVHSNWPFWDGAGAWGPRFLVLCLPMMVLPLGEAYTWLGQQTRGLRWSILGILLTLTAVVQIAAIGINFNTYFDRTRSESTMHYDISQSPIVANLTQLNLQLNHDWNTLTQAGVTLQGWSYSEGDNKLNAQFPRLAGPHATITITPRNTEFAFLRGNYVNYFDTNCHMKIAIISNHNLLNNKPVCKPRLVYILLPKRRTTIEFRSAGVTSTRLTQYEWYKKLGITMINLRIYDNHGNYPFWAKLNPPSRMPNRPFSMRVWASDKRTEFYDLWWYYLLTPPSSSSAWPVVLVIGGMIIGLGLVAGIPHLRPSKPSASASPASVNLVYPSPAPKQTQPNSKATPQRRTKRRRTKSRRG